MPSGSRRKSVTQAALRHGETVDEQIIYARTSDGLELKGALLRPPPPRAKDTLLLIWVHTRQQGFAEREYVTIGRLLAERGYHFLTIETRGHDFGAWYRTPDGPSLHGSAWEHFSDCVRDVDAWIEAAAELGYDRVVLIGHGFGGAKVLHFQAQRQLREVRAVVLASSGSSVRDKLPPNLNEMAQDMVDRGHGQDLLPWKTSGENYSSTVSAQYYLARSIMRNELYGTATLPPAIARVRSPVIAWYGRKEERPTRRVSEFLDWIATNAVNAADVDCALIDKLDFFYKGDEAIVVRHLVPRLARLGLVSSLRAGAA